MRTIETGLILLALASAPALGCGGTVTGGGGSGGDTTTSGTGGTAGTGGSTTSVPGEDQLLAVHVLRLGDTNPDGLSSSQAWKQYGFNLDGKFSTKDSVDLCKPAAGAKPSNIYEDGDGGFDNSFGKNILPIWMSLWGDFSTQANDQIKKGRHTLLLRIQNIGAGQTGTFPSQLFQGGFPEGVSPSWQGSDAWPIRNNCLVNGDVSAPKTQFPVAKVTDVGGGMRRWSSGSPVDFDLVLLDIDAQGREMILPMTHARIVMTLSDDNAHATSGMIGGIIETEVYIAELAKIAGSLDPSLCPPSSTFESISQQIRQASDILMDGSQDPSKTCDGISVGFGFDADGALLGDVFVAETGPDPCQM